MIISQPSTHGVLSGNTQTVGVKIWSPPPPIGELRPTADTEIQPVHTKDATSETFQVALTVLYFVGNRNPVDILFLTLDTCSAIPSREAKSNPGSISVVSSEGKCQLSEKKKRYMRKLAQTLTKWRHFWRDQSENNREGWVTGIRILDREIWERKV